MYFSKINTGHFEPVSNLLDSAVLMVKAINEAGNNGFDLIADDYEHEVPQFRILIQGFRAPYENSLEAICNGIKKRLDNQHEAIIQQLESNRFDAGQVAEYLKDYEECKAIVMQWEHKIESAGSSFYHAVGIVTSPFLALEQAYHARLQLNTAS